MNKLIHYYKVTSTIKLLSGIHIGGSEGKLEIGGIDKPVIRNPITGIPYIPGSSIKGRFRMALELKYQDYNKDGGPSEDQNNSSMVCKLFGNGSAQKTIEPGRLIFRDAKLKKGSEEYILGEGKTEIKMDRNKMSAAKTGPRTQERVAEGAEFEFELMIRVFEGDNEDEIKKRLNEATKIVELEFLGGSGTRGYGQVKFEDLNFDKIII
jgi:CRISPR-associated protein Csm3